MKDGTVTQAETSAAAFKSKITQWLLAKGSETRVGRVSIESDAGASNSEAMVCVQVQGRPASEQSFQAMRSGYVELPGGEQVIRGSGRSVPESLYHFTSLVSGLQILRSGCMMNSTSCSPPGVFSCHNLLFCRV